MRKNKHFYTILCLVLGAVLLTTAAVANFGNANGYSAYKKSLLKMLEADNYSAEYSMEFLHNGNVIVRAEGTGKMDANGEVTSYTSSKETDGRGGLSDSFRTESWTLKNSNPANSNFEYVGYTRRNPGIWNIHNSTSSGVFTQVDDEITDKMIRFMEVLADTFVGDLKNNFVLVSDSSGEKTYQLVLRGNQLPEIVTAGFSLIYSSIQDSSNSFVAYDTDVSYEEMEKYSEKAWKFYSDKNHSGVVFVRADGEIIYFENSKDYYMSEYYVPDVRSASSIFHSMGSEPAIDTAKMFLTLDSEGRLLSNTLEGTIAGVGHDGTEQSITLRINLNISDYGTTVIEKPHIPDNEEVYDYTGANAENDYAYVVTKDGVSTTYTDRAIEKTMPAEEEPLEPLESEEPLESDGPIE